MTAAAHKCWDCSEVPRCPSAGFEMTCSTGEWKSEKENDVTLESAKMSETEAAPAPLLPDDSDWPPATARCSDCGGEVLPGEVCRACHGECFTICAHGCEKPADSACHTR